MGTSVFGRSGLGLSCLQLMEPSEVPGSVNGDVEV